MPGGSDTQPDPETEPEGEPGPNLDGLVDDGSPEPEGGEYSRDGPRALGTC